MHAKINKALRLRRSASFVPQLVLSNFCRSGAITFVNALIVDDNTLKSVKQLNLLSANGS